MEVTAQNEYQDMNISQNQNDNVDSKTENSPVGIGKYNMNTFEQKTIARVHIESEKPVIKSKQTQNYM